MLLTILWHLQCSPTHVCAYQLGNFPCPLGDVRVRSPLTFAILASPRPITQKAVKVANQTYLRAAADGTAALALRQYPPRRRPFMPGGVVRFPAGLPEPNDAVGEAGPYALMERAS